MTNITIDDVMEYMIIMYSDTPEIELSNTDLCIMIDIIRDIKHKMNLWNYQSSGKYIGSARINTSRPKRIEMQIIHKMYEQLGFKIKYQPERITKSLLNKKKI